MQKIVEPEMPPEPLTQAQKRLLDYISCAIAARGSAPSYQEMMDDLRYKSKGAIFRLIRILQIKGRLEKSEKKRWRNHCPAGSRAHNRYETNSESMTSGIAISEIAIIGQISAANNPEIFSTPIPLAISSHLFRPQTSDSSTDLYGLIVQDTAFLSAHLLPGDVILVEASNGEASPGELVLATTAGETLIGHYFSEGSSVLLQNGFSSSNTPRLSGKKRDADSVQIWGTVVGTLRGLKLARADHA